MLKGYAPLIAGMVALSALLTIVSAQPAPPATNPSQPSLTVEQIEQTAAQERATAEKAFEAQLAQIAQRRLDRLNEALEAAFVARDASLVVRIKSVIDATPRTTQPAPAASDEGSPAEQVATERVVFIGDTSGSMIGIAMVVQSEFLKEEIERLAEGSRFALLFAGEAPNPEIQTFEPASQSSKRRAFGLIESVRGGGRSEGFADDVRTAFGLRPTAIWMVTDGAIEDLDELKELVRKTRATHSSTKLHVALFSDGVKNPPVVTAAQELATLGGGELRHLSLTSK